MFFNLLFRPMRAFQRIENGMNEALVREGMILYLVIGFLKFLLTERQVYFSRSFLHAISGFLYQIGIAGLWGLGIALVFYLIGRYLGGTAYFAEIFVLVAYAAGISLVGDMLLSSLSRMVYNYDDQLYWQLYYSIVAFFILLYLKILFQGLKYLNEFGYKKAFLTLLPLMILMAGLTFGVLNFLQK